MEDLKTIANKSRMGILDMVYGAKDSHVGCAMSAVDILVALYFRAMKINPEKTKDPARDRFILSKGHAASALYAVMSERGFFPKEFLETFAKDGSNIASHVAHDALPGVETTGGSGGHGLSIGAGMALVSKSDNIGSRVFVLTGDAELQEGSVWEAALFSSSRNLSNLTVIVDRNMFQTWSRVDDVVAIEPLVEKFKSFGWDAEEVDGHNIDGLSEVLNKKSNRPHAVIARTVKGKGVSFMEGIGDWHNGILSDEQYEMAIKELS